MRAIDRDIPIKFYVGFNLRIESLVIERDENAKRKRQQLQSFNLRIESLVIERPQIGLTGDMWLIKVSISELRVLLLRELSPDTQNGTRFYKSFNLRIESLVIESATDNLPYDFIISFNLRIESLVIESAAAVAAGAVSLGVSISELRVLLLRAQPITCPTTLLSVSISELRVLLLRALRRLPLGRCHWEFQSQN